MSDVEAPLAPPLPQRRVVLLHTVGPLAGLRRIMGVMAAETFPATIAEVNFLSHHSPCHLTRVEPRYVVYREQEPIIDAPGSSA